MKPKDHANLLSIFFWIFSGIQTLMVLFMTIYTIFLAVMTIMVAQEGKRGAEQATIMFIVIIAVCVVMLLFGLASITANMMAGYGLNKRKFWARRWALIGSIMSILSFLCGGILLMPLGIGLGVYGLWFVTSNEGKFYFEDRNLLSPDQNPASNQKTVNNYQLYQPYQPHNWQ